MYLSIFPEFLNSDEDKFLDDKQQLVVARKIVDFESLLNSWPQASHGMAVSIKQLKRFVKKNFWEFRISNELFYVLIYSQHTANFAY